MPAEPSPQPHAHRSLGRFLWVANGLLMGALLLVYLPGSLVSQPGAWLFTLAFAFVAQVVLGLLLYLPLLSRSWRWAGWLLMALEATRFTFVGFDLVLFRRTGMHVYSPMVTVGMQFRSFWDDIAVDAYTLFSTGLIFCAMALAQLIFWFLWRRWLQQDLTAAQTKRGSAVLLGCGLLAFGLHWLVPQQRKEELQQFLPLYNASASFLLLSDRMPGLVAQQLKRRAQRLKYPLRQVPLGDPKRYKRPHIFLVIAESLRADMLNPADMPKLSRRIKRPHHLVSRQHFSSSHVSQEGVFSTLYALYAHHRPNLNGDKIAPYPLQVLRKLGYKLVSLESMTLQYPGFAKMHGSFHQRIPCKNDAVMWAKAHQLLATQRRLPRAQQQPLFVVMATAETHHPYLFPPEETHFRPIVPARYDHLFTADQFRLKLWNRYRNSVRYLDSALHRLVEAARIDNRIDNRGKQARRQSTSRPSSVPVSRPVAPKARQMGPRGVAWVLMGDHGEAFWDHGLFGHGVRLNDARIRTPFVLHFPGLPAHPKIQISSHVDLFPTLFDLMKLPLRPKDYSDGQSLLRPDKRTYIQMNTLKFPRSSNFGLITRTRKIFARRTSLFALEVNEVFDRQDRPVSWTMEEIMPTLRAFMRDANRLTPKFQVWRYQKPTFRRIPGFPFRPNFGPIRSHLTPQRRPWERMASTKRYISQKAPSVRFPKPIVLGPYVKLLGYNLRKRQGASHQVTLGEVLEIELVYQCTKTPPQDWKLVLRFDMPRHPWRIRLRHSPVFNTYPVWKWLPGQYIRDPRQVLTSSLWQQGRATLRIGLWHKKRKRYAPIQGAPTNAKGEASVTQLVLRKQ